MRNPKAATDHSTGGFVMTTFAFRAAAALAAASTIIGLSAVPAMACQTVDDQSSLVLFHETKQTDIPDGMVQFRVRIDERTLRNVHSRDLIRVYTIPEGPPTIGRYVKANGTLQIVKPAGTSCQGAAIPKAGRYYVTGWLVNGADGKPISINGGVLFRPRYKSVASQYLKVPLEVRVPQG